MTEIIIAGSWRSAREFASAARWKLKSKSRRVFVSLDGGEVQYVTEGQQLRGLANVTIHHGPGAELSPAFEAATDLLWRGLASSGATELIPPQ